MNGWAWVDLLAAASGLLLAALAMRRDARSPLSLPLVLLALNQVALNLVSLGYHLTGGGAYSPLGAVVTPPFTALAFDFVARFLGQRAALRREVLACYLVFALQVVAALIDLFRPGTFGGLPGLALGVLITSIPVAIRGLSLVWRHLRGAETQEERARAGVLLTALVTATLLLTTDLWRDLGLPVPMMSTLGSFAFNVILTFLSLRLGLLSTRQGESRAAAFVQALVLAMFIAVSYLALFLNLGERHGPLLTSFAALTLAFGAGAWVLARAALVARQSNDRFTTLGRFSAQLAHDLKNPLAAARGAAEFLAEELRRQGHLQHRDFSLTLVQQLDRLGAVVSRYQRLSDFRPELARVDLNGLVAQVLRQQPFGDQPGVALEVLTHPAPLPVALDQHLVAAALENLLRNAWEAMPRGGTVTVATSLHGGVAAVVSVRDSGEGMNARTLEQSFEPFFTTRAAGSGLGLPFAQQVARAHGGSVRLSSREGSGTLAEFRLPLGAAEGEGSRDG